MRKQKESKLSGFNIYDIEDEYRPSDDIFCEDEELIRKIKYIIYNKLSETDRRIILAYSEIQNVRDTAKLFRVSPTTIWNRIQMIKRQIYSNL